MPSVDDPTAAFHALYERHRVAVWRYFRRRTDAHSAEDLTTDVFVVVWRRRGEPPDDVLPWLYGIARHVLSNHRRSEGRAAALAERARQQVSEAEDDHAELANVRADVAAALRQLRPADREVLLLVAWEGLTSAEAAKVLGCRAPAARARLYRARKRMRAALRQGAASPLAAITQESAL